MKRLTVGSVIVPIEEGVALKPSVGPEEKITDALELMLKNNVKRIAVARKNEIMGMVRLEDALKALGLDEELKSKNRKSVVVHGRKITLEK